MKKNRSTKRALLMSALSMVLCLSMLVGSTFAWFTDSVTSSGNKIVAGTLDVDLYLWNDAQTSAEITNESDPIFGTADNALNSTNTLWEPGKTQVAYLSIKNDGNLTLKYKVDVVVSNPDNGKDLYKVMEYAIVPDAAYGEVSSWTGGNAVEPGLNATQATSVSMDPGAEHFFALAIHMKEEAGNEYQGGIVEFDIVVTATQKDAEEDSFGPEYDKGLVVLPKLDETTVVIEKDGIQYYYDEAGNYVLYNVTENYTSDTVNVPEGVDSIGNYAFAKNSNVKTVILSSTVKSLGRGFDSSAVEKVVLKKGLEKIDSRAFRSTANLKEVVIPSSVKEIEDNAFQKSGIKNIVIPATVKTIGEAAFGASEIETVIFEGNTSIQGYAFRGCPNLRTVYLYGDDVTFIASTLNGRNSMWFCNGESNNPNTSKITFYVTNDTVKERVKAAMGAEADNTKIIILSFVDSAEELSAVLAAGGSAVLGADVEMEAATTAPYGNKYAVKLDGGVLDGNGNELYVECYGDDYGIMTSGGTIKNLTIKEGCRAVMIMYPQSDIILDNVNIGGDGVLYPINTGEAGAAGVKLIVTNSTLAGWTSYDLIESASFTNVEFKQGTYYNNIYGRVLKPYVNTTLTNCSFVEHMNLDLSSLTNGHKVTMTNCTVNGQPVTAETFTVPTTDDEYDTKLFTVDLPSWATSINDCIVFG